MILADECAVAFRVRGKEVSFVDGDMKGSLGY